MSDTMKHQDSSGTREPQDRSQRSGTQILIDAIEEENIIDPISKAAMKKLLDKNPVPPSPAPAPRVYSLTSLQEEGEAAFAKLKELAEARGEKVLRADPSIKGRPVPRHATA